jgi:hypothetical protein
MRSTSTVGDVKRDSRQRFWAQLCSQRRRDRDCDDDLRFDSAQSGMIRSSDPMYGDDSFRSNFWLHLLRQFQKACSFFEETCSQFCVNCAAPGSSPIRETQFGCRFRSIEQRAGGLRRVKLLMTRRAARRWIRYRGLRLRRLQRCRER